MEIMGKSLLIPLRSGIFSVKLLVSYHILAMKTNNEEDSSWVLDVQYEPGSTGQGTVGCGTKGAGGRNIGGEVGHLRYTIVRIT